MKVRKTRTKNKIVTLGFDNVKEQERVSVKTGTLFCIRRKLRRKNEMKILDKTYVCVILILN